MTEVKIYFSDGAPTMTGCVNLDDLKKEEIRFIEFERPDKEKIWMNKDLILWVQPI